MTSINQMNYKKMHGFDRVPMNVILDAKAALLPVLVRLFYEIFRTGEIPHKWLVNRVIPVYKKGQKDMAENYRPISNICSVAKIFEKCILNELEDIAHKSNKDLTGSNQFGFKKGCSTMSTMLEIQTKISNSIDKRKMCGIISLDLSAAFDTISKEILIDRLKISGLDPPPWLT